MTILDAMSYTEPDADQDTIMEELPEANQPQLHQL